MKSIIEQLVDFGTGVKYDTLPKDVAHESKRILLDSIGCALAGLSIDKGKIAVRIARELGGPAEARIIGNSGRVSASSAALANGELINALDYDACTIPPGHVTPYVLPAALAMAEKNRATGKSLICAIAASHEVAARFGPAMAYYRDIKPGEKISFPPVSGFSSTIFGGTLGAGMVMGLDSQRLAYAMGIAGLIAPTQSNTKWARTLPASTPKYVMAGCISQTEILSLMLAEGGYTGDTEVLETEFGFWRFIGSSKWNPDVITDKLGKEWKMLGVTIYKPYPHCRITHTILDCFYHLAEVNHLDPEEIEEVKTYADPHCVALPLWQNRNIKTPIDAQMSVPFAISAAANRITIGPEWQDMKTITDKNVIAFMDKVQVLPHPDFEKSLQSDPSSRIGKVEIKARGKTFSEERKHRKGSPATKETRMTDAELIAKFKHNAARVLPADAIEKIPGMILKLEDVNDVSQAAQIWS
ncbi:MAG: MmgE/PrpD family protein [Dehalococcoidales bacterium]|nr:MmgE/PrpD family protein [Dehalococcoidales bacterium]